MKPLSLPLIRSNDEGRFFLPLKGLNPDRLQGVEFRINKEKGILDVFCYSSGFGEENDQCEGRYFPVVINEKNAYALDDLRILQIIDPEDLDKDYLDQSEKETIREYFPEQSSE